MDLQVFWFPCCCLATGGHYMKILLEKKVFHVCNPSTNQQKLVIITLVLLCNFNEPNVKSELLLLNAYFKLQGKKMRTFVFKKQKKEKFGEKF